MDELDWRILEAFQNDFPLSAGPYEIIARKLKIPCDELWNRIERMVSGGVIRRIGASLDSHKLGFCSTLAAVRIGPNLVDKAAVVIGRFPEVTHSYLRRDDFNIWFTIIAADEEKIKSILEQIRSNLPMKRLFKLDVRFKSAD
jgi:DNA-binding Lrp family transcriptional regulator